MLMKALRSGLKGFNDQRLRHLSTCLITTGTQKWFENTAMPGCVDVLKKLHVYK